MANEYRTTCWYCGEKLADSSTAKLEEHGKKGVSHNRFLTDKVTAATEAPPEAVPLEEGLAKTNEQLIAESAPAPAPTTKSETDASKP